MDLIELFGQELEALPASAPPEEGPPTPVSAEKGDGSWLNDPVPVKLEKIRAAFLDAKTPQEVTLQASIMPLGDWLDMVVRLSPKNIQVQGAVSFKHMLEELGPIDKEAYRPKVIDAEFSEMLVEIPAKC